MPQTVFTQTFTVHVTSENPDFESGLLKALERHEDSTRNAFEADYQLIVERGELLEAEVTTPEEERTKKERAAIRAATRNAKLLELKGWLFGENEKQKLGLPSEWDQGSWGVQTACGTSACIAGKTVLDAGGRFVKMDDNYEFTLPTPGEEVTFNWVRMPDDTDYRISEKAGELLGLEHTQRLALFEGDNTYEMAAAVIDAIIAGDEDPYVARAEAREQEREGETQPAGFDF